MISPSNAAREAGKLLTPIAEREEGFEEPNDNGRRAEDYWKDEYLGSWLNAEEDIWAIKVFVSDDSDSDDSDYALAHHSICLLLY